MFKVLLVDDEVFVCKGLQKLVKWEQYNCTIIGEARNGGEALEMINQFEPDVVITDIMMPVLDGLELIKSVKEEARLDPEFIIISGYNDFKYAQQAIRYGVKDYILKPIDVNELGTTLKNIGNTISQKQMLAFTQTNYSVAAMLEVLLQEDCDVKEAERYAEMLGIGEDSNYLFVWAQVQSVSGKPQVRLKEIQDILSSLTCLGTEIPVFEFMPGRFGMLWGSKALGNSISCIQENLEAVRNQIAAHLKQEIIFYTGEPVDDLLTIKLSYYGANEAMKHKFAEEGKGVILYGQVKAKGLQIYEQDSNMSEQLMIHLEENNKEACDAWIEVMFQSFREERYTPSAVIRTLSRFSTSVMGTMKQMNGTDEEQRRHLERMEAEEQTWSLLQLKEHFRQMVTEAADYIAELRKEQYTGEIGRIKKYIDSHYSENISLKSIAAKFYMNPAYLGQLFRKTYHVYFNDYLLQLRVEEAKRLLRQTDLRMYEIAERVGFLIPNYFVTQFEKIEKCSPLAYRNNLKRNG